MKCEAEDKERADRELGSSNGHVEVLPREGGLGQAVCAAAKHNQHSPFVWKQVLKLFIQPNPEWLFTHYQP